MPYDDEPSPFEDLSAVPERINAIAGRVIGAAIEVHDSLGPCLPRAACELAQLPPGLLLNFNVPLYEKAASGV
jgi:hypothetical protein